MEEASTMKVLIPIAHGSESLETVAIVNVLRRAGVEAILASLESSLAVNGTRDIKLTADVAWTDAARREYDAIVLPGGDQGAGAMGRHIALIEKLRAQRLAHKWYGGICAAPALALAPHGLLD